MLRKSRNCTDPVAKQFAARNRTVNISLICNAAGRNLLVRKQFDFSVNSTTSFPKLFPFVPVVLVLIQILWIEYRMSPTNSCVLNIWSPGGGFVSGGRGTFRRCSLIGWSESLRGWSWCFIVRPHFLSDFCPLLWKEMGGPSYISCHHGAINYNAFLAMRDCAPLVSKLK